jgi:hypothetical protein
MADGSLRRLNKSDWSNGGWIEESLPAFEDGEAASIAM